ncbi:MAG: rhamnulokinase [Lachnospiraceae bacterium]
MKTINCIAADLGASGGKMAKGTFNGNKIKIDNYIHFDNKPIVIPGALYWDIFGLYNNILDGITKYASQDSVDSVAVDTWGASYGFLDKHDRLLEPVYHYRDNRTLHTEKKIHEIIDEKEIFELTGCQCNRTYTLPQLYSYIEHGIDIFDKVKNLLFLPDLFTYFMSGEISTEMTIAGTSALMNTAQEEWCIDLLNKLSIPSHFLTNIVDAGTVKGIMLREVGQKTGAQQAKVIATAAHDSAAAVTAIPGFGANKLYISIGTNVSMGVEILESIVTEEAFRCGFKNTGGFGRRKILYRDFAAFWLMNELRRVCQAEGNTYTYEDLIHLAEHTNMKQVYFDLEEPEFNNADGDIRVKINSFLKKTGQDLIQEDGEYVNCILESISRKIKHYATELRKELNIEYTEVFVINGGSRNHLLMQMISDGLGMEIKAGMPHATLAGNILGQLYAEGHVKSIDQMRELSKQSFKMELYEPK